MGKPATSLHQQLLTALQQKIFSGEWPPGYRIPIEHDLCEQFGCSRMTVNKVVAQLAGAGLIERRRRAGSFVSRPQSLAAVMRIQEIESEVAALGLPYRFEVLDRRTCRADRAAAWPKGDASKRLLRLHCRHFAGSLPFCIEERLIGLAAVPEAEAERFEALPPGTWLLRRVPWSEAEHRIRAVDADARTAALLAIGEAAACLVVERRTWEMNRQVTAARLTYPSAVHELVARFQPSRG